MKKPLCQLYRGANHMKKPLYQLAQEAKQFAGHERGID
jgi:hypothetical protein